ncbi:MAG: hypothetical protein AMK73_02150 [Planctomycetes bacterium SM23_32]|nr:MAG: hypothetical protein AMK73_02150 [Planctomycetes bacterium SM23_32]
MEDVREAFAEPGSAYRGKPFWAWNGKLDSEELRRQIRVMHRMGLGGFFMHSRVGLATEYLSEEWFRMVRACVDEARKLGMEAWLYDEDRWPSGAAGGLVTRDPRCQHKNLQMVIREPGEARFDEEPLALFSARLSGTDATDVRRLGPDGLGAVEPADAKLLAFFVVADAPSSWYNDATYLDTMSHEAVQRFIEVTYDAYRERIGEEFGPLVPGIFTDEPNHGGLYGGPLYEMKREARLPWTPKLPEVFRDRYGYDILDHLPELFFRVDGRELSQPRHHYHDCKTFLFVDAFGRQIYEWCEENGLKFTGHVLSEESLKSQTSVVGSAMRFYEFMQAPGIDILTEHGHEYATAKQCSSVLRQTGRRWLLSELYGCTGWDFPFEGHKAVGDWQAACGINLRCQHLSWYTMAGQAKRDYPASIHYQSPWWEHYPAVEDYFGRVDAVMSRGRAVRRLLVVHPVESVWARTTISWHQDEGISRLEADFERLIQWLLDGHVDFDFGDEEMMARLAAVEAADGPTLKVGEAPYAVALVPPTETLRGTTLALLRDFKQAGGKVVFCEPVAGHVDALASEEAAALAGECECVPMEKDAVVAAVEDARLVGIADANGAQKANVLYLLHREGDELRLFMCNADRRNGTGPLSVSVQATGNVQLWDAETGRRYAVAAEQAHGGVRFATSLAPSGSRLFVVTPAEEDLPPVPAFTEVTALQIADDGWTAELTEPNVLVLDMPEHRIGDGEWQEPLEVLKADGEIRKAVGLPLRGGSMVQPWARRKTEGPSGPFALRYRFHVDEAPPGPLHLAIEQPHRLSIGLNGRAVSTDAECGWWVDRSLRLLPLDEGALKVGENELLVAGTMDDETNLEICYLLGDFAVTVDGADARITGPLSRAGLGDWREQGLPFYSGSVVHRADVQLKRGQGDRVFVEVPEFRGACARVLVDGREAGVIGWQPHELEVTDLLPREGQARLAVEVVGHRRNAFGPLHHAESHPRWTGPETFVTAGEQWQDDYNLVPVGLMAAPRLSIRRQV